MFAAKDFFLVSIFSYQFSTWHLTVSILQATMRGLTKGSKENKNNLNAFMGILARKWNGEKQKEKQKFKV